MEDNLEKNEGNICWTYFRYIRTLQNKNPWREMNVLQRRYKRFKICWRWFTSFCSTPQCNMKFSLNPTKKKYTNRLSHLIYSYLLLLLTTFSSCQEHCFISISSAFCRLKYLNIAGLCTTRVLCCLALYKNTILDCNTYTGCFIIMNFENCFIFNSKPFLFSTMYNVGLHFVFYQRILSQKLLTKYLKVYMMLYGT